MFRVTNKNFIARLQGMLVAEGVDPPAVAVNPDHGIIIIRPEDLTKMVNAAREAAVRQALEGVLRH